MKHLFMLLGALFCLESQAQVIKVPALAPNHQVIVVDRANPNGRVHEADIYYKNKEIGMMICNSDGPEGKPIVEIYTSGFNPSYYFESYAKCLQTLSAINLAAIQNKSIALIYDNKTYKVIEVRYNSN